MLMRTLFAFDSDQLADRVESLLDARDVLVTRAADAGDVWRTLQREDIDLVVVDDALAQPLPEWVASIRGLPDAPELIVIVGREDPSRRAALLAAGCRAVLNSRLPDRELREALRTLSDRLAREGAARQTALRTAGRAGFGDIVAHSRAMSDVLAVARLISRSDSSVLILGETGVGKERLARTLHADSTRAAEPFVPVNCGAIPEGLLESELFGHEQGAFTGASRARRGHFEMAHRGTLFLDEIGELPPHVQVKLLRVLEDHHIQRLGAETLERIDVRIVAATNRDLEAEVAAKRFRADLYYRLAVVTLTIPPLRGRTGDIVGLAQVHLDRLRLTLSRPGLELSAEALGALEAYAWPGNVRELINVLERAVLLAPGPEILLRDLPRAVASAGVHVPTSGEPSAEGHELTAVSLSEGRRAAVDDFERRYLTEMLLRTRGRVGAAASLAGVTPRALYERMRRLDIRKGSFRS